MSTTLKARALTRRRILSCDQCELRGECRRPVPFSGPTPARLAVVGEAPGRQEDAIGAPFVGPSGHLLKTTLEKVGIDPDSVFRCNAASCFPAKSRTPGRTHLSACRANLEDQLRISGARVVLVCGATALSSVTDAHRISTVRGRRLYWHVGVGRVVVPTWHPAAVLRDRGKQAEFTRDVGLAARLSRESWQGAMAGWGEGCCKCEEAAERYDEFGVGFCGEHAQGLAEAAGLAVGRKVQGVLL